MFCAFLLREAAEIAYSLVIRQFGCTYGEPGTGRGHDSRRPVFQIGRRRLLSRPIGVTVSRYVQSVVLPPSAQFDGN